MNEDFEREALRDFIYLQEELELLKQELLEEDRFYILEFKNQQHADKQVAKICRLTPEGLQLGSDVPFEPSEQQQ